MIRPAKLRIFDVGLLQVVVIIQFGEASLHEKQYSHLISSSVKLLCRTFIPDFEKSQPHQVFRHNRYLHAM